MSFKAVLRRQLLYDLTVKTGQERAVGCLSIIWVLHEGRGNTPAVLTHEKPKVPGTFPKASAQFPQGQQIKLFS